MEEDKILENANQLIKTKKLDPARKILEEFLKDNRNNIYAWWLYAETFTNIEQRKKIWGYCLRFNPDSAEAKKAITTLEKFQESGKPLTPIQEKTTIKTSLSFKLFSGCAFLFILAVVVITFQTINSRPINPEPYYHSSSSVYYLYVPENYTPDQEWDLFVGIHGGGGSGLDCWNLWQTYADKEKFILLCPSIPGDGGGFYQDIGEIVVNKSIEDVRASYRIKPKMFFAGFSAGAFFIQGYAYHYPNSVSGLAILSTGYTLGGVEARVPMILVTGNIEHPESLQANEAFYEYMKSKGFDVEYHVLPFVGHWVTNKAKRLTIELFRKASGN